MSGEILNAGAPTLIDIPLKEVIDEGEFEVVPQQVDAESSLVESPIAQSGAISIAGGVVAAASAMLEPVKDIATTLSVEPLMIFAAVGIIVGIITITQRNKQRSEGWA